MRLIEKINCIEKLNSDTFLMRIESENISSEASAGQFVNIKCGEGSEAFLRRPISICSIDRENKTFDIVFNVRGKGTKLLSRYDSGDEIDVMGPLGRGFTIDPSHKSIAVVGGGIGIFPLLQVLKDHPAPNKTAILGFRTRDLVVLEDSFNQYSTELLIATDDGSYGHKGFVTDLLSKKVEAQNFDMVYFCGPSVMMKLGVEVLKKHNIPSEVSVEQRMGCGIGACLVCACKTRKGSDWDYSHVCKDGPVFKAEDIIFD
ncbi:MAG: dihydroorotate dehydrogenase electron transfer subunit [Clostridiaceae bacterium]|nr:dihydroorotate dehydrogenase electron transfer subunit [Clostridiaceae bacterium]